MNYVVLVDDKLKIKESEKINKYKYTFVYLYFLR